MKVRRVGVDGVAVRRPHALAQEIVSHRDGSSRDLAKPTHQTRAHMASTLPEELVKEILLRVPPDEPAHLVRAALVCKAWHCILSDYTFLRRYRRFHRTPSLQGYIHNDFSDSTIRFVPTTSMAASAVCAPKLYNSSSRTPSALDCRHGRVLIQAEDCSGLPDRLIVWDPIAGSQQHLRVPAYPQCPYQYDYVGAVLCAKDDCDHLDCHGGPFLVVLVGMSYDNDDEEEVQIWTTVYSSETGAWSAPTTPNVKTNKHIDDMTPSLLIGDALYFNTVSGGYNIVKYDLCKHKLTVMDLPGGFQPILIKANDGGLGLATMLHNCVYTWSWQVDNKGVGGLVKYRVIKLDDTLLPEGGRAPDLICMAEGTNTVFIRVKDTGLFTLDLKSRQVRKIGETETYYHRPILPYVSFYTPKD